VAKFDKAAAVTNALLQIWPMPHFHREGTTMVTRRAVV